MEHSEREQQRFEYQIRQQVGRRLKLWLSDGGEPFSGVLTEFNNAGGFIVVDSDTVIRTSEIIAFNVVADA